jgi:small subunit ribosomal protein S20
MAALGRKTTGNAVANIKQQKKRVEVAARQRLENLRYRSTIKTYFRRLQTTLDSGDAAGVESEHRELIRLIDKAAAKRALHPNNAARKKARAARIVAAGPRVEVQKKRTRKAPARKAAAK